VPAKLYEYLGAGQPILALAEPDSDIAWALRGKSGVLHRIVPPRDAPAIKQSARRVDARKYVPGASPSAIAKACSNSRVNGWPSAVAECLDRVGDAMTANNLSPSPSGRGAGGEGARRPCHGRALM